MEVRKDPGPCDVIVVGAGVIGLSIARELALRGLTVTVLEKGSCGSEASFAAGGMLGPQAEANAADDFFCLACESRDRYRGLAHALLEETGIDIQLDTTGTLYLAFTDHDEQEIDRRYKWQSGASLPVSRLSTYEARALEPLINSTVRGGLKFPNDIQVDNRRLVTALVAANEKLGVRLLDSTTVGSIEREHGRVCGVKTFAGTFCAPQVVLAAGAWTNMIGEAEVIGQVKITPVRGQMVCLQTVPRQVRHVLYSPRGYLVPRSDGRILAGSTTEQVGFRKEVTAGGLRTILANAVEIAPDVEQMPITSTWAGLRPCAEDKLPVIGRSHLEGLFFATGHYRNGILLAPITAELLGEMITGNFNSPLLNRFTPDRFELIGAP